MCNLWRCKLAPTVLKFPVITHRLTLRFNGRILGEAGLAGFTAAKDDWSAGDNRSYKTRNVPVKSSPPANQHPTNCLRGDAFDF